MYCWAARDGHVPNRREFGVQPAHAIHAASCVGPAFFQPILWASGLMTVEIPQRFSREWWSWLLWGVLVFGAATFAVSVWLGLVTDPISLVFLVIGGSVIGDLLMALSFEAIAPQRVTLGPGERHKRTDALKEMATVLSGFSNSAEGRVRVRGEIWAARHCEGKALSLKTGEMVRVVERDRLVLLISEAK